MWWYVQIICKSSWTWHKDLDFSTLLQRSTNAWSSSSNMNFFPCYTESCGFWNFTLVQRSPVMGMQHNTFLHVQHNRVDVKFANFASIKLANLVFFTYNWWFGNWGRFNNFFGTYLILWMKVKWMLAPYFVGIYISFSDPHR